ncbi:hypothetical protein [Mucilaginibacter sp.]
MKKIILIIGCALLCIAASVSSTIIISQPAIPKQQQHGFFTSAEDANNFIGKCIRQGYVIKFITASQSQGDSNLITHENYIVVAEKY